MDDLVQIIRVIASESIQIVISALVLYAGFRGVRIADKYLSDKLLIKGHNEKLDLRDKINPLIDDTLKRGLYKAGASRAYVFEYHNGGAGLDGMPFLKMSSNYEVADQGVKIYRNIQNVSLSYFPKFFDKVNNSEYYIVDVENPDIETQSILYSVVAAKEIGKTVMVRILGNNNRVIGIVGFDYNKTNNNFKEENIEILKEMAIDIGGKLSIH